MIVFRKIRTFCKIVYDYIFIAIGNISDNIFQSKNPIQIYDTKTTLKKLYMGRNSISRFGDGEFDLILGKSLGFQDYNASLAKRLEDILKVKRELDEHIVAIPYVYNDVHEMTTKSRKFWKKYFINNRKKIYSLLNVDYYYSDAQITRIYVNRKNKNNSRKYFEMWKDIWKDKKLLIVEGEYSRFGIGNDMFESAKSIRRILCPATNAYSKYYEILDAVCLNYVGDELVLLVLGPTATVMAYDLAEKGIQAFDIGNLDMEYEWLQIRANRQEKIAGKYTVEAKGGTVVEEVSDNVYLNQIIMKLT